MGNPQTADRLIDVLQLAVFNADEHGRVCINVEEAKAIGSYLRYMAGVDAIAIQVKNMELTVREAAMYRTLVTTGKPLTASALVELTGIKTCGSVWAHKCRLSQKLARHRAGGIATVGMGRGRAYVFVAEGIE